MTKWFNEKNDIILTEQEDLLKVASRRQFGENGEERLIDFLLCEAFEARFDPAKARALRLAAMIISRAGTDLLDAKRWRTVQRMCEREPNTSPVRQKMMLREISAEDAFESMINEDATIRAVYDLVDIYRWTIEAAGENNFTKVIDNTMFDESLEGMDRMERIRAIARWRRERDNELKS